LEINQLLRLLDTVHSLSLDAVERIAFAHNVVVDCAWPGMGHGKMGVEFRGHLFYLSEAETRDVREVVVSNVDAHEIGEVVQRSSVSEGFVGVQLFASEFASCFDGGHAGCMRAGC